MKYLRNKIIKYKKLLLVVVITLAAAIGGLIFFIKKRGPFGPLLNSKTYISNYSLEEYGSNAMYLALFIALFNIF